MIAHILIFLGGVWFGVAITLGTQMLLMWCKSMGEFADDREDDINNCFK